MVNTALLPAVSNTWLSGDAYWKWVTVEHTYLKGHSASISVSRSQEQTA